MGGGWTPAEGLLQRGLQRWCSWCLSCPWQAAALMLISVLATRAVLSRDLINTLFEELCRPVATPPAPATPSGASPTQGALSPGEGDSMPQEHLLLMVHLAKVRCSLWTPPLLPTSSCSTPFSALQPLAALPSLPAGLSSPIWAPLKCLCISSLPVLGPPDACDRRRH